MIKKSNLNICLEKPKFSWEFMHPGGTRVIEHTVPVCKDIVHPVSQASETSAWEINF